MAKSIGSVRVTDHDPTQLGRQFKKRLKEGKVQLGGMVFEYVRPSLVKLYRLAGFDFIYMDNEHVLMSGLPGTANFIQAARDNGLPVIAKIPELGRAETGRLLDGGVVGIQLPRTESREQLETLVDYVKYPPIGSRAGAPLFGNVDYQWPANSRQWLRDADDASVVMAHIETRTGLENFEDIVATPHLDMVYVGVFDFSISMGHPGEMDHPEVQKGMQHILDLCLKHNVPFGTTTPSAESARHWIRRGAGFFEVVDELTLLAKGAAETVDMYREAIDENIQ